MDKAGLIAKITNKNYTHEQLLAWVESMPNKTGRVAPAELKAGDVLMHPVFKHPYVLLSEIRKNEWVCTLLTSDPECREILEACDSRFFGKSFFTKALFTSVDPEGSYMAPFENQKQVKEVHAKLKTIFVK